MEPEKSASAWSRYSTTTCSAALFSPRFDPVLKGGEGDEDPMIPPQMPRGRSVRQAVFHYQPNRRVNHPVRIVALRRGQVLHVGVEVTATSQAMVWGVSDLNIPRSAGN